MKIDTTIGFVLTGVKSHIQKKAIEMGTPYQTLISRIIHRACQGNKGTCGGKKEA
jgi:hypothetical protein